eukprot:CAMPEP_0198439906 /NCGR_PEP_ID=MMETSP1452-20131203/56735_1 /TAXON_ID=1181717 /ORGANISM="Synchroma pusillum, Strain CCMP3072" /LENGTH=85 /DNA_ID=CAMNT_0044160517 /DNA_START=14 /DNA_END=268 /DNA_ORIENTATION=+
MAEDDATFVTMVPGMKEALQDGVRLALEGALGEADEVLIEYVAVMIENGKRESQVRENLATLLDAGDVDKLVEGLHKHLGPLQPP